MVTARFWTRLMVLLMSMFLLSACGGDDSTTTTTGTSEGTLTPVSLALNAEAPHSGTVGNESVGKSYYTATVASSTTYIITLYGLSADADLEVYNDRPFTYILGPECASRNGSTTVEHCTVTTNSTTTTMNIAVDGQDTLSGATYSISVNAVSLLKSTCTAGYNHCFDFESGLTPPEFVQSGTGALWSIDSTSAAANGTKSFISGVTPDPGTSCFSYTPPEASSFVSFNRKAGSEPYNDLLLFYIDDVLQPLVWSGTVSWERVIFNTVSATHTYKWCYSKNSTTTVSPDSAWVDDIGVK
ncbi:MAG: hypothetical protein AABZ10_15320 [Nitrospirota bacterium]